MKKLFKCALLFLLGHYLGKAQGIKRLEHKADSLYYHQIYYYSIADFQAEIAIRNRVIAEHLDTLCSDYKISLAKKFASEASYRMHNMDYEGGIALSKSALEIYQQSSRKDPLFEGMLKKRLYYAYSALKDPETTRHLVRESLQLLKDTLGEVHPYVADVEFDLGLHDGGQTGDCEMVIEQYKKAISISTACLGQNNRRAAIQEHHLALVYGFLGYYQKEKASYEQVIKRWEAFATSRELKDCLWMYLLSA